MTRRILITGADGQLGRALQATCPVDFEITAVDATELDITDAGAVRGMCAELVPQTIINAAAYTAVDRAEEEPHKAYVVNRDGARIIAEAAAACGARLIHVSTDFVFSGTQGSPYTPQALTGPLQVYGASKLAGEQAVRTHARAGSLILRTAWLYAAEGQNFVTTMLRLMHAGKPLRVIADQVGTPTWAESLALAIWRADKREITGLHHWSDAGVASWYDFAVAIQEEALVRGVLDIPVAIEPIRAEDYPLPAKRPAYSVLDKTATWAALGITAPHWRDNLRRMLERLDSNTPTSS